MNEPTILVPGFNDDVHILRRLVNHLKKEQLDPYPMSPQPSNGMVGIDMLAAQLGSAIELAFGPDRPINLVGFSMGGLICRTYVQKLGGVARTRRLVTVATPHQGTWSAYTYNRPACLQMRPGSAFLAELNEDVATLAQVQFSSIWSPLDLTILPATSSCFSVGQMLPILSPFHGTLLFDPRVLRLVTTVLQQPVLQRERSEAIVESVG
ncbi:MAG: alpha/beta fold hydrolase [Caldilineaceae bacterium]